MLSQRARRELANRYKELASKEIVGSDMWCIYTWLADKYKRINMGGGDNERYM